MKTLKERETERDRRNLNPHKAAVAAMWLWGEEYSKQNGGSMDFWDRLPDNRKQLCRDMVKAIYEAQPE